LIRWQAAYTHNGAKEHYVLDFEDSELAEKVVRLIDLATPMPKPKKKSEET
jgi:hypothetical protein